MDEVHLTRNQLLDHLSYLRDDHERLYAKATGRPMCDIEAVDHMIAAVLRRSNSLIQGFLTLLREENELAAVPLIRLQADSILRLSAFRKVDDPTALAEHMMADKRFDAFDRSKLRDVDLRKGLEGDYAFLSGLYEKLSGYIHFSLPHLINVFDDWERAEIKDDDEFTFGKVDELPKWSEERKREALLHMVSVTGYLVKEVEALQALQS